ncbi:MAG: hypothetical protein AAB425_03510, partial [Bdellovibrionota bacterium]
MSRRLIQCVACLISGLFVAVQGIAGDEVCDRAGRVAFLKAELATREFRWETAVPKPNVALDESRPRMNLNIDRLIARFGDEASRPGPKPVRAFTHDQSRMGKTTALGALKYWAEVRGYEPLSMEMIPIFLPCAELDKPMVSWSNGHLERIPALNRQTIEKIRRETLERTGRNIFVLIDEAQGFAWTENADERDFYRWLFEQEDFHVFAVHVSQPNSREEFTRRLATLHHGIAGEE